ncbi:MAG: hypothetical protein QNJ97_26465 [Myxococcota bacterium]|nr:hypothetical protein [Myxococcota bacterium]
MTQDSIDTATYDLGTLTKTAKQQLLLTRPFRKLHYCPKQLGSVLTRRVVADFPVV